MIGPRSRKRLVGSHLRAQKNRSRRSEICILFTSSEEQKSKKGQKGVTTIFPFVARGLATRREEKSGRVEEEAGRAACMHACCVASR